MHIYIYTNRLKDLGINSDKHTLKSENMWIHKFAKSFARSYTYHGQNLWVGSQPKRSL